MPAFLVLVFVIVPLIELAVILQVGQWVGPWWTIALLVAFSIVGAALLRQQGRRAWRAFREALEAGRWPGDEVTQGALVIVGGTLLLTPGFFTDAAGFLLLLPPTRAGLSRLLRSRLTPAGFGFASAAARRRGGARSSRGAARDDAARDGDVLDVEVVDVQREEIDRPRSDEDDEESGTA